MDEYRHRVEVLSRAKGVKILQVDMPLGDITIIYNFKDRVMLILPGYKDDHYKDVIDILVQVDG